MLAFRSTLRIQPGLRPFRLQNTGQWSKQQNRSFFWKKSSVPAIYKPRQESWLTPTMILVGVMPIFTFALGTWQLYRLQWKVNLIDELEEKLALAPLTLPAKVNLAVIPEFVWRKVALKGTWDHPHSMIFAPRVREGVHGVHVVTPLVRQNGSTVLVDRGFVSNEQLSKMQYEQEQGEVEVLGMLRTSQPHNSFTPHNHPAQGKWYWTDVDAMAEHAGGEAANVQPVLVEQIFEGHAGEAATRVTQGVPVGRPPTIDLRNAHLSYVVTWYGLSGLTTFGFVQLLLKRRRSPGKRMPRFT